MDITTVSSFRAARTRADLDLAPGETILSGGTWLMSEPQPETTGFVDITTMAWTPIEASDRGLRISATCTIAALVEWARARADAATQGPSSVDPWPALSLIPDAANALLASFKIWNTATVGGNICRAFAAGAMTSLAVALDGVAEVWTPAGASRWMPVQDLVTGNGTNALARGEVVRAIELPATALRSRALLRKIALAEHGRSGAVVTGRINEDGSAVFTVTAATTAPRIWRFATIPAPAALEAAVQGASGYYTDPLGSADWRRAVSGVLAERIRAALAAPERQAA